MKVKLHFRIAVDDEQQFLMIRLDGQPDPVCIRQCRSEVTR
jgi:hypothetical protein